MFAKCCCFESVWALNTDLFSLRCFRTPVIHVQLELECRGAVFIIFWSESAFKYSGQLLFRQPVCVKKSFVAQSSRSLTIHRHCRHFKRRRLEAFLLGGVQVFLKCVTLKTELSRWKWDLCLSLIEAWQNDRNHRLRSIYSLRGVLGVKFCAWGNFCVRLLNFRREGFGTVAE